MRDTRNLHLALVAHARICPRELSKRALRFAYAAQDLAFEDIFGICGDRKTRLRLSELELSTLEPSGIFELGLIGVRGMQAKEDTAGGAPTQMAMGIFSPASSYLRR